MAAFASCRSRTSDPSHQRDRHSDGMSPYPVNVSSVLRTSRDISHTLWVRHTRSSFDGSPMRSPQLRFPRVAGLRHYHPVLYSPSSSPRAPASPRLVCSRPPAHHPATDNACPVCPSKGLPTETSISASHIRIVLSSDPEMMWRPSRQWQMVADKARIGDWTRQEVYPLVPLTPTTDPGKHILKKSFLEAVVDSFR